MKQKRLLQQASKYLFDSDYRFLVNSLWFYKDMPDEEYIKKKYKARTGKKLNLDNPQTYNEKPQWLKLYDRNPRYTVMADKYLVREIVLERLGEEYLIPLLGVWDTPDEIDFESLPKQFVLKCNHNSGLGMCICRDKSQLVLRVLRRHSRKVCHKIII